MSLAHASSRLSAAARLLSPFRKMPSYAIVYVTSRCQARCGHCFFWRDLDGDVAELTLSQLERIAAGLGPLLQLTLTGGSPELRKDLPEIVALFSRRCRPVNVTICMLGALTARIREQVAAILRACPDQKLTIGLSLDGVGAEHDEVRRLPGLFDHLVSTFRALDELRRDHPNLAVNVGITVSALNYRTAVETSRWASDHLPYDDLKPILVRGTTVADPAAWDPACFAGYTDVLAEARAQLDARRHGRGGLFRWVVQAKELVQRDLIQRIFTTGRSPVTCSGARETVVIWPNGDVAGCEMRPEPLGNVRDEGQHLRDVWLGPRADAFRDTVGEAKECQGCHHHCFITPAIFRSPGQWARLARRFAQVAFRS